MGKTRISICKLAISSVHSKSMPVNIICIGASFGIKIKNSI